MNINNLDYEGISYAIGLGAVDSASIVRELWEQSPYAKAVITAGYFLYNEDSWEFVPGSIAKAVEAFASHTFRVNFVDAETGVYTFLSFSDEDEEKQGTIALCDSMLRYYNAILLEEDGEGFIEE